MTYNRRKSRSNVREQALHHWLRAVGQSCNIAALVLADGQGRLVASSTPSTAAKELAAITPRLARRDRRQRTLAQDLGLPLSFYRLQPGDARYYLCAAGDPSRRLDALKRADEGVRRILHQTAL